MSDTDLQITFGADASGAVQGVNQVKSALGDFAPKMDAVGKSVGQLGEGLKSGFSGFGALAAGLRAAGEAGADGFAGLAQAGEGVADVARLITEAALAAASAIAEWAAQTAGLSVASADAKKSATILDPSGGLADNAGGGQKVSEDDDKVADAAAKTQMAQVEAAEDADKQIVASHHKAMAETVAATNDASSRIESSFRSWIDQLVPSFSRGLMQMAEGTKSFAEVMRSMGQIIVNDLVKFVDQIVERWLMGEVQKLTASKAGAAATVAAQQAGAAQSVRINAEANLKHIASDAAAAAGAAYRAMAGIPPAPLWGVIAAGTAYAGVMAFEGLASAAQGFDVPVGVNPLTRLHAQEMVLPARLANPMRDMLASREPWGGGGGHSFSFGDTVIQGGPNMGRGELEQVLSRHRDVLMDQIHGAVRGGWTSTAASPFRG